jgi:hypothetical protein
LFHGSVVTFSQRLQGLHDPWRDIAYGNCWHISSPLALRSKSATQHRVAPGGRRCNHGRFLVNVGVAPPNASTESTWCATRLFSKDRGLIAQLLSTPRSAGARSRKLRAWD